MLEIHNLSATFDQNPEIFMYNLIYNLGSDYREWKDQEQFYLKIGQFQAQQKIKIAEMSLDYLKAHKDGEAKQDKLVELSFLLGYLQEPSSISILADIIKDVYGGSYSWRYYWSYTADCLAKYHTPEAAKALTECIFYRAERAPWSYYTEDSMKMFISMVESPYRLHAENEDGILAYCPEKADDNFFHSALRSLLTMECPEEIHSAFNQFLSDQRLRGPASAATKWFYNREQSDELKNTI